MANRRFGSGPQRGGRGFPPQNANVSPWQGNAAPAGNQLNNPNIQTQLALALTSLLQPQQQANEPPSLLSLNTSPGNFNQDNYPNRFGSRGRVDFRRSEPYNKNQRTGGWRDRGNRGGSLSNRARSNAPIRDKNRASSKDKSKTDKKSSDKALNDSQKSEKVDNDETRDEEGDTKRDWKEEKNTGDDKKEDGTEKKDGKEDNSKFAGLPNSLLHCFVCNKSMWDGDSFQNHVRGKAHVQMLDSLEESFQITVKILRENMRLAEEKKMIEWNRMQRSNRKFHARQGPESHCNMCDLKFLGKIIAHRKTEGHQRLKRFLHPNCDTCNLEFPSRMEWVDHRFAPEHLFKVKEVLDAKTGAEDGYVIEDNVEWDNEPLLQESLQTEDENPVLELDDDLANLYNRVPVFNPTRAIAKKSMTPLTGFFCEICLKCLRTEEDSENHLKSEKHYHEFVSAVKNKFRSNVEKADKESKLKRKREEGAEGAAAAEGGEEGEEKDAEAKNENGGEMYDPEEACKEGGEEAEAEAEGEEKTEEKEDDEKWVKVDAMIADDKGEDKSKDEEVEEEEEAETEAKTVNSPATRRRTNVKNGAGPKSKKVRKT